MTVLLLLVALIAEGIAQTNYNCQTPSQQYNPITRYVNFATNTGDNSRVDNICHTFFRIDGIPNTYQMYYSVVNCDGSVEITTYIVQYNSESDDYTVTSPSCSFISTLVGNFGEIGMYRRQVYSGDCTFAYPLTGSSPCPHPLTNTELSQIKQMISSSGLGCPDIIALPMRLPSQCVTTQSSTYTGSTVNCPAPCYNSGYPNYNIPTYYYNPSGCGCSQ